MLRAKLRLSIASRLSLAFSVLGLAVVFIVTVGALSLERINRGVTQVVQGAAPAQKTVAELQIRLQEISRLALEHYNSITPEALKDFEAKFHDTVEVFERNVILLDQQLGNLEGLGRSQDQLMSILETSRKYFDQVDRNMAKYDQSLQTETTLEAIRADLQVMRGKTKEIYDVLITGVKDSVAKMMIFESSNMHYESFAIANELSLIGSLAEFDSLPRRFDELIFQVEELGSIVASFVASNNVLSNYQTQLDALTDEIRERVMTDNGLIPIKRASLESQDALRNQVTETQAGLVEQVQELRTIADQVNQTSDAIGHAAQNLVVQSRIVLIVLASGALIFAVGLSILVVRSIRRPLTRLRSYMNMVGKGDFTVRFGEHSRDELGNISQATEQLVDVLRRMIANVHDQNQTLNRVALDAAGIADDTRNHVECQHSELDMVVTAINEMTSSIREVAGNAEVASKEMHESEQDAKTIEGTVGTSMGAVQALEDNMTTAVSVITQLDEGVTSIEDILATIRSIAEQTNLLALNAAIEAARAGEQGRGFAVVADEVRTLAGRTQQSTEEIREKVERMLKQSAQAVKVIETSQQSTQDVSEQTQVVQQRFTKFMGSISRLNELNMMIATASEQQYATTEEINRNLVKIREMSESTAEGAQKAADQTHQLQGIAEDLNQAVSHFRV